ncbi:MAG: hypothetical protein Q4C61_11635 [Lachnospiraceae bacterium]|nr:hypothetical protein [Lachnospiraceae bacterium]
MEQAVLNAAGGTESKETDKNDQMKEEMKWVKENLNKYIFIGKDQERLKQKIEKLDLTNDKEVEDCYQRWWTNFQGNPLYAIWGVYFYDKRIVGRTMESYFLEYDAEGGEPSRPLKKAERDTDEIKQRFKEWTDDFERVIAGYKEEKKKYAHKEFGYFGKLLCSVLALLALAAGLVGILLFESYPLWKWISQWKGISHSQIWIVFVVCFSELFLIIWIAANKLFLILGNNKTRVMPFTRFRLKLFIAAYAKKRFQKGRGIWEREFLKEKRKLCGIEDLLVEMQKNCEICEKKNLSRKKIKIAIGILFWLTALVIGIYYGPIKYFHDQNMLFEQESQFESEAESEPESESEPETVRATDELSTDAPAVPEHIAESSRETEAASVMNAVPLMSEKEEPDSKGVEMDSIVDAHMENARFVTADTTNIRAGCSDEALVLGYYAAGRQVDILEWIPGPQNSLWGKIWYSEKDCAGWINRKTLIAEYEDLLPVASCRTKQKGELPELCDGDPQSIVSFRTNEKKDDIVINLQGEYLPRYLVIYSGNYSENEYDKCGMVSEIEITLGNPDVDGQGTVLLWQIERDYDVNGLWIPLEKEVVTDRVSIRILNTDGKEPVYISDILLLGESGA